MAVQRLSLGFSPEAGLPATTPVSLISSWQRYGRTVDSVFTHSPVNAAHNSGSLIIDPSADIPDTFPWIARVDGLGNYMQFGLAYPSDLTAVSASLVLQFFGNSDPELNDPDQLLDGFTALPNLAGTSYEFTLTPAPASDPLQAAGWLGTDPATAYRLTRLDRILHVLDMFSFRNIRPTVKTAFAGTFSGSGTAAQAFLVCKGV